jgi:hypothetical protein
MSPRIDRREFDHKWRARAAEAFGAPETVGALIFVGDLRDALAAGRWSRAGRRTAETTIRSLLQRVEATTDTYLWG